MGMADSLFDDGAGGVLVKVGVFVLVQALVYLILSSSSTVFSEEKAMGRLRSFQRARSLSIRRAFAAFSDMPPEGEPSPSAATRMPTIPEAHDEHQEGQ
ncbi:hypothetical protein Taro_018018 [Colocasia esculenta]|uniref:Uncharacterized protein n=1 Tax=Colocasia esculenta TaxID=4460 RepID=A0A843UXS7_COLES|nr:hypothetical protein [Colocasia esculenta]